MAKRYEDSVALYKAMLEVKYGKADGGIVGWLPISKKCAKECGIKWDFVESSAKILGLKLAPHGRHGYTVTKPE